MTRKSLVDELVAELLAQKLNRELWHTILVVARAQVSELLEIHHGNVEAVRRELLTPKPRHTNRVRLNVTAQMNGVPVEDL